MITIQIEKEVAEYAVECVEKARERVLKAITDSESKTVRRARLREKDLGAAFIAAVNGIASAETPGGLVTAGPVDGGPTQAPFELHNTAGGANLTGDGDGPWTGVGSPMGSAP